MRKISTANRAVVTGVLAATAIMGVRISGIRAGADAATQTIACPTGFADVLVAGAPPFIPLASLATVPNPVFPRDPITGVATLRADLTQYIADPNAAIQLGKALFWDVQAGSDNATACATCHSHAGSDARERNQLAPGANNQFADTVGFGPNHALQPVDFPFTDDVRGDTTDNVAGSQGVRKSSYGGLNKAGAEITTAVTDPVFTVNGRNIRQVTGMQTPSVVNAVFNHRNFWNGRAQPDFNGVNPWGTRDLGARVWALDLRGSPSLININIQGASLASQAVGPALNDVEMSASGRTFPELGKKLLALKPLGLQAVHAQDSVLGPLADRSAGKGLKTTYAALIQSAFQKRWWNANKSVTVNGKSYSMMQANFSLYWGLSIMLYEATLVSDRTPMDRYLATRGVDAAGNIVTPGDPSVLQPLVDKLAAEGIIVSTSDIENGLTLFERAMSPVTPQGGGVPAGAGAGCAFCHVSAELTSASVRNLSGVGLEPGDVVFKNAGFDLRMERMFMQIPPVPAGSDQITYDPSTYAVNVTSINQTPVGPMAARTAVYDAGWYNVAVRPSRENAGLGAKDPFGNFLSWTQFFQSSPYMVMVPGGGLGCASTPPAAPATSAFAGEVLNPVTGLPLLSGTLQHGEGTDVDGSFKTPSLRNVELTGPYFHNGGKATLRQVVESYDQGGDFRAAADNVNRSPLIMRLNLTPAQVDSLVAFLLSLTDERVRLEQAPFDHPQLTIPNGADANGADLPITLPAVGAAGAAQPIKRFLNLNPAQ